MNNLDNWMKYVNPNERLPPQVKLTLLQNAVRGIPALSMVETLDEYQSATHGHGNPNSLSYNTYYDLLINACIRYDVTKKDNVAKSCHVYCFQEQDDEFQDTANLTMSNDVAQCGTIYGGIDTSSKDFYQVNAMYCRPPKSSKPYPSRR